MSALDDAASMDPWAHRQLQRMKEELTRLRARLEVREDGGPDGIECRDETIRMQDREIDRLRAENDELKDMLHRVRRAIKEIDDADCYVALQAALRGEPSK